MKTKTLLITSLLSLAGGSSLMAQVYSQNVVGYVNLQLPAGFSMIANPLTSGANSISSVISGVPDGTLLYKFNGAFGDANEYVDGFGWVQNGNLSTAVLTPGEGFFVQLPSAATVTFTGEVLQGNLVNPVPAGFAIRASKVPQSGTLTALGYTANDGDLVYVFDSAAQTYKDAYEYVDGFGWVQNGSAAEPTLAVGQSFFAFRGSAGSWNRTFSVN